MKQWELLFQVPKNNVSQINSCATVEKGGPWSSESEKVKTVVGGRDHFDLLCKAKGFNCPSSLSYLYPSLSP